MIRPNNNTISFSEILTFREYLNELRVNADRHLRNTISEIDNDLNHLMEDIKNNAKQEERVNG